MSKSVVMHFVRNGVQGEYHYETIEDALSSGMIHIENEISVPLDITCDAAVVYTQHEINAKWREWARKN